MGLWLIIGFIALAVVQYALRPRPPKPPAPSSLGDFDLPTAQEGRPIPVLWGTGWLKGPNVVWAGDFSYAAVKQKDQVIGYRYYMGQQLVLCHGQLDELLSVRWDERPYPGSTVTIDGTNDGIPIYWAGSWYTAHIAHGLYSDLHTLAIAATTAIGAAISDSSQLFKMVYGFDVRSGFNDELIYSVAGVSDTGNKTAKLRQIRFQSLALAMIELARAINESELAVTGGPRISAQGSVDASGLATLKITKIDSAATSWTIRGFTDYTKSCLETVGVQRGADITSTVFGSFVTVGSYTRAAKRFHIGYSAFVGKLGTAQAGFTARTVLGWTGIPVSDITIGQTDAYDERILSGIQIDDAGDFWRVTIGNNPWSLFRSLFSDISGEMDIYKGTATQTANDYLEDKTGRSLSAWRGIAYGVLRHFHVGDQPYIKAISFLARRCPNQLALTGGDHNINGNANPACMLYELWTNQRWGMRRPVSQLDLDALRALGAQLADEGFGLSMILDGSTTAGEMFDEILRHIDAVKYTSPSSGKLVIELIRPGYAIEDILHLDDDTAELESMSGGRAVMARTSNVVNLTYVDRDWDFTDRVVKQDEPAIIQALGEEVIQEVQYRGITDAAIATKVAYRVLRTASSRPVSLALNCDRSAAGLRPGKPVLYSSARYGISGMPMRVKTIRPGDPRAGKVALEVVEDVFGPVWATFTPPGAPTGTEDWTPATQEGGWGVDWGEDWG